MSFKLTTKILCKQSRLNVILPFVKDGLSHLVLLFVNVLPI